MKVLVLYCFVISFIVVPPIVEGNCNVVSLAQWGGAPSGHVQQLLRPVSLVLVTHTVTPECYTDAACESTIKSIRTHHKSIGMKDIGLSFLVGGNGKVYEGAGWRLGSHTLGYNDKSISLSFIGDHRDKIPAEAALKAATDVLACFRNSLLLHPDYQLMGHRQVIDTISPGDALQNLIQKWPHWSQNVPTRPH